VAVLVFPQSRPSVLVLNDCPDTLELLSAALQAVGFHVRGTTMTDFRDDVEGTVRPTNAFPPDVVVYDIGRGDDDDWTYLRWFTELPQFEGKPLVITTTNVVKVEGQRDAVYVRSRLQFLSTPYDVTDLVARVSAGIGLAPIADRVLNSPPGLHTTAGSEAPG
jgi:CheY-like chemotaxis protein